MTTKATKIRLIKEYKALTGKKPSKAIVNQIGQLDKEESEFFEWVKAGRGYALEPVDPFGFKEIGHKEIVERKANLEIEKGNVFKDIITETELAKLMINHDSSQFSSSKAVLDGFGMDRLIECYAEGLEDEDIAKQLSLRPSQIKRWLVQSNERVRLMQQLKDILRTRKVNKVLDEGLDYTLGPINCKNDLAVESMKLDAMKFKSKVASDLDSRSRVKEYQEAANLPVVNLGIQVNVEKNAINPSEPSTDGIRPVLPNIIVHDPDS